MRDLPILVARTRGFAATSLDGRTVCARDVTVFGGNDARVKGSWANVGDFGFDGRSATCGAFARFEFGLHFEVEIFVAKDAILSIALGNEHHEVVGDAELAKTSGFLGNTRMRAGDFVQVGDTWELTLLLCGERAFVWDKVYLHPLLVGGQLEIASVGGELGHRGTIVGEFGALGPLEDVALGNDVDVGADARAHSFTSTKFNTPQKRGDLLTFRGHNGRN